MDVFIRNHKTNEFILQIGLSNLHFYFYISYIQTIYNSEFGSELNFVLFRF